jgi:hypothetical protein
MSSSRPNFKPIQLFYSYSHADESLRNELETHISLLKRQGIVTDWYDRKITPGTEWEGEVDRRLNTADVILLLISADFVASDYCYGIEMHRALERHNRGETRVVPIILRPVDWAFAPFGKLQALPRDAKAITTWDDRDEAFASIAKGIRLICEELQSSHLRTQQTGSTAVKESLELFEVFKPSGVPTVTFVEPDGFGLLKLALAQPGRGIVIEGPSGIGKTTALKKAVEQLQSTNRLSQMIMLTARKPEDVQSLETLPKWHKGVIAIDDFHRLGADLKETIINYLKYLADSELIDKKLVVVGIPQTGRKLIEISFDIALRIEICKLGKVKDETIFKMISKGEQALNISLDRKTDIARAAAGSLNIAQLLCYQIVAQENISATQSTTKEIHSDLEGAISQVMGQMALKFGEVIRCFASFGGPQNRTCIELLQELASTEDGFLPLYPLKDIRPELAIGIDEILKENYIEKLYNKVPISQNHILLDETTPALIIDDPQMIFYLRQTPASRLVKHTGKREGAVRNKVFVSYSHADKRWLGLLLLHLKPLERIGAIELWDDSQIRPGSRWRQEIEKAMRSVKVVVLLISANYLASDFVAENEMPPLLAAAEEEGTIILSLILSPSLFNETSLAQFQTINAPAKPLVMLTKAQQEEVFVKVAEVIERALSTS